MKYDVRVLKRETCYQGFFQLEALELQHTQFEGGWGEPIRRELIQKGSAAAAILYDPNLDSVVMVEQFRIGSYGAHVEHEGKTPDSAWTLELVAGFVESGESPEDVIYREAQEEAGCVVSKLMPVYSYLATPGNASETTHLLFGRVDASQACGIHGIKEEGEDILVHVMTVDEMIEALHSGRINTITPMLAVQWLQLNHERLPFLLEG
jgi:ADP-ribose pyrophosphatase